MSALKTGRTSLIIAIMLSFFAGLRCTQSPYIQGEILYSNFCESCHMQDGSGLGAEIPPLAGADYVGLNQEKLACMIRHGLSEEITVNGLKYHQQMPGVEVLSDVEITNIINYVNQAWGNDFGTVTLGEVRTQLEACKH